MALQRKLGRATDQRKAILKGLVSSLFEYGRIETTLARAKEVQKISEKLISIAIKEADSIDSKKVTISAAKLDAKGQKILKAATSVNKKEYRVVDREIKSEMKTVDSATKLHARKQIMNWVYKVKDKDGNPINLANKILDEIAPKYKERKGGYTRIYKLGQRRGDAAEVVILELV